MHHSDDGEFWEATTGDLGLTRWTAPIGGATLVRLRITNDAADAVAARIVEAVPEEATDTVLVTTTGDEACSWRRVGDRVVHEFAVPAGGIRTNAYLHRSDEDAPISVEAPEVHAVETETEGTPADVREVIGPLDEPTESTDDESTRGGPTAEDGVDALAESKGSSASQTRRDIPIDAETDPGDEAKAGTIGEPIHANGDSWTSHGGPGVAIEAPTGTTESSSTEDGSSTEETAPTGGPSSAEAWSGADDLAEEATSSTVDASSSAGESESVVEELLESLEEDATHSQVRALRGHLGASESERARLDHVRSRLNDLAAYVDALEALVDDHGLDVIDDLSHSTAENASATEALREDLTAIEDDLDDHRRDTEECFGAVERELIAIQSEFDERLETVEASLEATRSELASLHEDVRSERQARARETRRFDRSLSAFEETLDRLEASVEECESFRRRFTAAMSAEPDASPDDRGSSGPVESDLASTTD